jgi:glycosyltransferase involved in cell wall biosynthesis
MIVKDKVSVILPTSNRYHVCKQNIESILTQVHPDFEIIVCDDSDLKYYKANIAEFKTFVDSKAPKIKYLYSARFDHEGKKDYGLARARNFGIIEATGEFLVFLDDRMTPATPTVLTDFVKEIKKTTKVWYFGDKGAHKTSFVENFSAIRRSEIVDAGMFCERIDKYGGMTKELHGRYSRQGFNFRYFDHVLARQLCKSSGWDKKDQEIPVMKKLVEKLFSR